MLRIQSRQAEQIALAIFTEKLEAALLKDVPDFAEHFEEKVRKQFMREAIEAANEAGLVTEQGIASYALAVLYLGPDFDRTSLELARLLQSKLPEVRRVHAMNEWVHAMIGAPDNVAAADQKLKEALKLTKPWGD